MTLDPEQEAMRQESLREQQKEKEADEAYFDKLKKQPTAFTVTEPKAYPCGKTEMDIVHCPDCLDHFVECATKSRQLFHENVMSYMELKNYVAKNRAEEKKRRQDRTKCRSLAKRILKKSQEIAEMRKELSQIFYYDGLNRVFTYDERHCDPKNEKIREALRD